jgi:hypothetical protein
MPAATPRLALPYPIPDDTVDVPRDVQALATKLDGYPNLGVIGYGSTLPPAPADGQEFYYVVPLYNNIWHLIYQAASTRWMYLGGAPIYAHDANSETRGPFGAAYPTFIQLGGAGGQCTLPKGGLYDIDTEVMVWLVNSSPNVLRIRPFLNNMGGSLSGMADSAITLNVASEWWQWKQGVRVTVPAPGGDIVLGAATSVTGPTVRFERKTTSIRPVYIYP